MIGRRGLFGLLASAPVAAGAAISGASQLGVGIVEGDVPTAAPPNPIRDLFHKMRHRDYEKRERRGRITEHLPPHIRDMKSWSPAFKAHVFEEERASELALWGDWPEDFDDAQMLAVLRKIGAL